MFVLALHDKTQNWVLASMTISVEVLVCLGRAAWLLPLANAVSGYSLPA